MNGTLETPRLLLTPSLPDQIIARFAAAGGFPPEVSPAWIEKLHVARGPDPWVFGYDVVHRESQTVIGSAAFKGAPGADGVVEIAYGIDADFQRQGYATEAAATLVAVAFADSRVRSVCAHTLPGAMASARVLEKCGFTRVGDVVDPEDGLVWRFEKSR
jgi:ribosomal-protein-alanine N-acetyltransferase